MERFPKPGQQLDVICIHDGIPQQPHSTDIPGSSSAIGFISLEAILWGVR